MTKGKYVEKMRVEYAALIIETGSTPFLWRVLARNNYHLFIIIRFAHSFGFFKAWAG